MNASRAAAACEASCDALAASARSVSRRAGLFGQRLLLGVQPGHRLGECLHPALIDLRHRRHQARGAADVPVAADAEQHAGVAGRPELVDLDEAGVQAWTRGLDGLVEDANLSGGFVDPCGHGRGLGVQPPDLFDSHVALDFELAEVAEQRALFGGQDLGFVAKRGDPIGGARRGRRWRRLLRGDGDPRTGQRHQGEQGEAPQPTRVISTA